MFVRVDLEYDTVSVSLEEPENCQQFHVVVHGDAGDALVGSTLDAAGVGRSSPTAGHVYVNIDALRSMAKGRVGDSWADDFEGMLGYASSKGWLDESGSAIEAHIERD
jgi:hypothetical protein